MSLSSISSQMPCLINQHAAMNPRLLAGAGNSYASTMMKVAALVISVIASIGVFVALGPIVGLVTVIICGLGLLELFKSSCNGSHQHLGRTWFMNNGHNNGHHVNVGGGHLQPPPVNPPHVGVGRGHLAQQQHRGHNHPPGNVAVGGGLNLPQRNHGNGPVQPPAPTGPNGHVPVGRRNGH